MQKTSHHCPEDLFIIDGLIWSPNTGRPQQKGTHFKVLDLRTGEIKKDFVRRYPTVNKDKFIVVTNGFDSEEFHAVKPHKYKYYTILYAGKVKNSTKSFVVVISSNSFAAFS